MKKITWKRWEEIQQEASEKASELPKGHVRKKEALYNVTIRKLISKEEDAAINYLDGIGVIAVVFEEE